MSHTNTLLGISVIFVFPLRYTHWFDGMAMMHRFHICEGSVTYSSRFLQSDSYVKNSEKDRIVVSEFGTMAMPDPCKNIFARFFSRFQTPSMSVFFTYCILHFVLVLSLTSCIAYRCCSLMKADVSLYCVSYQGKRNNIFVCVCVCMCVIEVLHILWGLVFLMGTKSKSTHYVKSLHFKLKTQD